MIISDVRNGLEDADTSYVINEISFYDGRKPLSRDAFLELDELLIFFKFRLTLH